MIDRKQLGVLASEAMECRCARPDAPPWCRDCIDRAAFARDLLPALLTEDDALRKALDEACSRLFAVAARAGMNNQDHAAVKAWRELLGGEAKL